MTEVMLAAVLGLLFAVGTFLLLQRDVVRAVWGVAIISQAANVYLITMGDIGGTVPIVSHGGGTDPATVADPLVQALVLTAIVIGFGTIAFALVLTYRLHEEHGTIDLEALAERRHGDRGHAPVSASTDGGRPASAADDEAATAADTDTTTTASAADTAARADRPDGEGER